MSEYQFIIDNMIWSFSNLNSFNQCKYEWYLQRIERADGKNNFYAEYGSFCHKILEKYAKGELGLFELAEYFELNYDKEVTEFVYHKTADIRQNYKEKGIDYFENIDLDLNSYEILGIEKKCNFEVEGKPFIGFIDLLLKDKQNGDIIVLDHKSSEYPIGKRGKILKSEQKKFQSYKRQLYLYAIQVYNEYGVYPVKLVWNFFKQQKWLAIPFDKDEYLEAQKWAIDTIHQIEKEEDFPPTVDFYYCHNLCRYRNSYCEYKNY